MVTDCTQIVVIKPTSRLNKIWSRTRYHFVVSYDFKVHLPSLCIKATAVEYSKRLAYCIEFLCKRNIKHLTASKTLILFFLLPPTSTYHIIMCYQAHLTISYHEKFFRSDRCETDKARFDVQLFL